MNDTKWSATCRMVNGRPVLTVPGQGEIPEQYRLQAALNIRLNQALLEQVIDAIGIEEMHRRYPETFMSDAQLERLFAPEDGDAKTEA